MRYLSVPLSCLRIFRTHCIIGQREYLPTRSLGPYQRHLRGWCSRICVLASTILNCSGPKFLGPMPLCHNSGHWNLGLFSLQKNLQNFSDYPSHRIFGHMHETLNINKKIKLITQFRRNSRDKSFKPS
jgi:hypothetical protein